MASIRRAIVFSSLGRYVLTLIGLISTMVIARLLSPAEIGTFAVASSLVMIMAEFRVLGANAYLIREKDITDQKIRASYGLTLLVSWSMGIAIIAGSGVLARYFEIPELQTLFIILSVSFFAAPYISIPHALLSRDYKFGLISNVYIASAVGQLVLTVILIYLEFSFYALAYGNLLAILIQATLFLYGSRSVRVYKPSFRGLKVIARVGIYTSLGHVLRKAQNTVPDIVIGKMGTTSQVGVFSRGLGFMVFLTDTIMAGIFPVAAPYLADIKNTGADIAKAYVQASALITSVIWPVLAVGSVASLPAIRLMFGDQWDAAAPIASAVAFWAILKAPHILAPQAFVTMNLEREIFVKEIVVFFIFLVAIIVGFKMGGIQGVATAFVFSGFVDLVLSSFFARKYLKITLKKHLSALFSAFMVSILCFLAAKAVFYVWPAEQTRPILSFFQLCVVMPTVWIAGLYLFRNPLRFEVTRIFKSTQGLR
ncbi:oligosaccharide flippase family protein [Marinobacter salsuginis]|uniref:oligosaccharide flippase family protein n=1 Tax=Marinobacter salsuginis TaxID=418719 RepID=UPI001C942F63|nr:oligosaccharide flippase family protein [Marinobacter salsuginis]MBY6070314.1 oligosaccharide flippase family protein [Marinobacter salsuginis]